MNGASEQRATEVFVELAGDLLDEVDVPAFLQNITERCVELLGAWAATLVLTGDDGRPRLVSATTRTVRDLVSLQLRCEQGPCVDTFATGEALSDVTTTGPHARQRWPEFTAVAQDAGVRSTSALPLRSGGRVVGVLELFSDRPEGIGAASLSLGQALADVAAIGLLRGRASREPVELPGRSRAAAVVGEVFPLGLSSALSRVAHRRTRAGSGPVTRSGPGAPSVPGPDRLIQPLDLDVLRLIAAGAAGTAVARRLGISPSEVTRRLSVVRVHLGVSSTAAAVHEARRAGLV